MIDFVASIFLLASLQSKNDAMNNAYAPLKFILATLLNCIALYSYSQNVFWSDSFDAPAGGGNNNNAGQGWSLNTSGTGTNQWFLNQPTSCGSGTDLHISCSAFPCNFFGGPQNPIFNADVASDNSAISPAISTLGLSNITLSFKFSCVGETDYDYGTLALSNDGGATWNELSTRYQNIASCSTIVLSLPTNYQNVAGFKMKFRWVNDNSGGTDPAFNIDDITLSTTSAVCLPPTVNAGSTVSICGGESTTIGGTPTATGGTLTNYTYSWSPATGLSSTNVANPTANPTLTTTYTVTVNGGDATCSATSTVTVNVGTAPSVSITPAGSTTICPGASVLLNATAGLVNYVWSTPGGSLTGASIQASLPGTYSVSAQNGSGCSGISPNVAVQVSNVPVLTTNPSGTVNLCAGQNLSLSAATGFTNYVWSTPSGSVLGESINASAVGTYTVAAQFQGCSIQSAPITVSAGNSTSIAITVLGSPVLCLGESVVLTAPGGFQNYQWSNGETGPSITVSNEQSITVSASSQGCVATSEPVFISVSTPLPLSAGISGPTALCPGAITELQASAGFTNYTWTGPTSTLNGQNVIVGEAGNYSVEATDINGCVSESNSLQITAIATPALNVTPVGPISICAGETATLSASAGFGNYLWNTPSGTVSGQSIEANEEGNYNVQAVFSSCILNSSSVFVAVQSAPTLSIALSGSPTVCIGESVQLTAENGYSSYLWSNGSTSQSIAVSTSGSYFVTAASAQGCDAVSEEVVVSVIQAPIAAFTFDQIEPQNTVQFTFTGAYANDFTWIFGGGVSNNAENPVYQFPYEDTWPITLIVSNPCGSDTLNTEIEIIKIGFENLKGVSVDLLNDGMAWMLKGTSISAGSLLLSLFSSDGRLVHHKTIRGSLIAERIDYSELASGIYVMVLESDSGRSAQRLLKP